MPEQDVTVDAEEWLDISRMLEEHHALFYQCWSMGRPSFTRMIDTAAVTFNRDGEYIDFLFNPDFWRGLTTYEKAFVISHECLHVILRHGIRSAGSTDHSKANIALDIVVNHLLVNSFAFDRSKLYDAEDLCWIDTVFSEEQRDSVLENESYEYYYNLVPNTPRIKIRILDEHGMLVGEWDKLIDKLDEQLSEEDKSILKDMIGKHAPESMAGKGTGGWHFVGDRIEIIKKKKWEQVIKEWSLKYLRQDSQDHEQWARVHRRWTMLPEDIILPSEMEEDSTEKDRLPVFLYLDTSGSCIGYKNRFWAAGASLPKERFDVRCFCFDTQVQETTIESRKIYGGGGTSFAIIEAHIQKLIKEEGIDYPEAVWIITDGYGDCVNPQFAKNWYWFLTNYSTNRYVPQGSKVFMLKDYE